MNEQGPQQQTDRHAQVNLQSTGSMLEQIETEMRRTFGHHPIALGAALGEIETCRAYPEYMQRIPQRRGESNDIQSRIQCWIVRRVSIWLETL